MKETLSIRLFRALLDGKRRLGTDAIERMRHFLTERKSVGEAFMNKGGEPDIYYTSFGWALAYVLGLPLDRELMRRYLESLDQASMDLVHYAAYRRCGLIWRFFNVPEWLAGRMPVVGNWADPVSVPHFKVIDYPNQDPDSPYSRFIYWGCLEDCGQDIDSKTLNRFPAYRVADGGFSNSREGSVASVNATAAALMVIGQADGYRKNDDLDYLLHVQDPSGGFRADVTAPVPDLLSTATALFVLRCYGVSPLVSPRDFIEAHWLDNGGFGATLWDEEGDVEYLFYGLLALGSL